MTRDLAITFAGGGNRAFYQLGLLRKWGPMLLERTAGVVSCSAGACVIATYLSRRERESADFWIERRAGVTRNFDFTRPLRGEPLAPHGAVYRDTLLHTFAGGGFERVKAAPFPIWVLASAFPRWLPVTLATTLGITLYSLERSLRRAPHPRLARLVGFTPVVADMRECESPEELAALILASSATPPFTPLGHFRGQRLLDGGMIDNVPAFLGDTVPGARRNLVLMTRPYHASVIGRQGNRLYIAPTRQPPVSRWDYTQPHLLEETVAMGEAEAELHWAEVERFLAE